MRITNAPSLLIEFGDLKLTISPNQAYGLMLYCLNAAHLKNTKSIFVLPLEKPLVITPDNFASPKYELNSVNVFGGSDLRNFELRFGPMENQRVIIIRRALARMLCKALRGNISHYLQLPELDECCNVTSESVTLSNQATFFTLYNEAGKPLMNNGKMIGIYSQPRGWSLHTTYELNSERLVALNSPITGVCLLRSNVVPSDRLPEAISSKYSIVTSPMGKDGTHDSVCALRAE